MNPNTKNSLDNRHSQPKHSRSKNAEMANPQMTDTKRRSHDFGVDDFKVNDFKVNDFTSPEPFPQQHQPVAFAKEDKHGYGQHSNNQFSKNQISEKQEAELIRYNHISYLLYLLSFFTFGMTSLIAVFINYSQRHQADGTWLATHFDWQIKTFWYSLIMAIVAFSISLFGAGGIIGWLISLISSQPSPQIGIGAVLFFMLATFILFFGCLWYLYRIIKGWIALADGRPV